MFDKLPAQSAGKWTFHLQFAQSLQLRITSEHGVSGDVIIDGHDISDLLDYLYDNRELIYEASHDQERQLMEDREEYDGVVAGRNGERILYIDDGIQRMGTII